MSTLVQIVIISSTWALLLILYTLDKFITKHRFIKSPVVVDVDAASAAGAVPAVGAVPDSRPGSFIAGAGVLFTFVINLVAVGVVFGYALSASFASAARFLWLDLPLWVNITGGVLFVLYSLWGMVVLFYNPNYTPLYKPLRGRRYIIATEGPYRWVRHPRYAGAALANLIFFLFTGVWLSLLGLLGWAAIYAQSKAEEQFLLALAPEAYGAYCRRTGMFFPRLRG
mgnify:CR=1 FL=1